KVIQGIHGGAHGAAAEQHVIHQHDGFGGDIERDDGGMHGGAQATVEIVPVHADIEAAGGDGMRPNTGQQRAQAPGESHATALNADEDDFGAGVVAFGDLMGDAHEGALNGGGVEDESGFRHKKSEPASARFACM